MTLEQFSSVPCPTCGAVPGKSCLQHSGAVRSEPHTDRKLSAVEAIEAKRYRLTQSREAMKYRRIKSNSKRGTGEHPTA
jgi:hypothetical protein